MNTSQAKKLKSYAKFNVKLKVGKFNETVGLHKINTTMYLHKELYDEIYIEPSLNPLIIFEGEGSMELNRDSNVHKLMQIIEEKTGSKIMLSIHIIKRIPVGAGLGGSASNAGTILKYIASIKGYTWSLIRDIAIAVGSDVPFFASGFRAAKVTGYGERVKQVKKLKYEVRQFYHFPKIVANTKRVFLNYKYSDKLTLRRFSKFRNDLLKSYLRTYPPMVPIMKKMRKQLPRKIHGRLVLCGSGSSFAVIAKSRKVQIFTNPKTLVSIKNP